MEPSDAYDEYAVVSEFYDHTVPYRKRRDVAFFVEMAREAKGAVLEVGCGTGRVLIPTARAGVKIVGLDLSHAMLALCRKNLERESKEVRSRVSLVQADMREFDLKRKFRMVTTPFRPFQHLQTVEDQIAALSCIHRHIGKGGRLVLDVFNPDLHRLADEKYINVCEREPGFKMPDGRKVVRTARILSRDLCEQIQQIELVHHVEYPDGRKEALPQRLSLRYFFKFELEHLLARTGFEVEHVYADYDRSSYGSTYPGELIFVAKKKIMAHE